MTTHLMKTSLPAISIILICCASGCSDNSDKDPAAKNVVSVHLDPKQTPSAHDQLSTEDLSQFEPGKSKDEILSDVQWRGTFFMAAAIANKPISAIQFNVAPPDAEEDELGVWVHAVFEDGKFVKFVEYNFQLDRLEKLPAELIEEVKIDGEQSYLRIKPLKIGDAALLEYLANAQPLSVDDVKEQAESAGTAPRQVDPGLTGAVLGLKAMGIDPFPDFQEDYQRNAKLRDQFNGARLSAGMSEERVEEIFRSKPLETGQTQGGTYKLFGTPLGNGLNVKPGLLYCNVLTLFDETGNLLYATSVDAAGSWRDSILLE